MYQLFYISRATRPLSDAELMEILKASRLNNPARQITGMLLYADMTFFQILEGPKKSVEQLYDKLLADQRHYRVLRRCAYDIDGRDFPGWSMGFQSSAKLSDLPSAFFELSNEAVEARTPDASVSQAREFMKSFLQSKLAS